MTHLIPSFPTLVLLEPVMDHFFGLVTELACTQTLFYFSFRFFFLAVNKSPAVYLARSTDFEKKIEGL